MAPRNSRLNFDTVQKSNLGKNQKIKIYFWQNQN